ncbi:glycine betaine ABC transporter substrate-binding protein [Streptomyces marincola]|uniref:ABC-type glycine betaine transport system substrate-binding domain-containing protein n=1 Tax=Streptomyces marincola TaxID=2878388 RepID=A0A1W7CW45_9ACTN|nr:glycine betaine ABC transporter substrate-binding protein [Streptomyces marincola]ARQ68965.1 hypothetical protein CAG99_08895 [Streptomyces marincola]
MPTRHPLLAGLGVLSLVATSACDLGIEAAGEDEGPVVRISMPHWPGGQANVAVAAYVLENELGVSVERVESGQREAWEALGGGAIHAILEDWGALPDRTELYVAHKGRVVDAGPLGITGHVGWYIPGAFADAHPEATDWHHLDEYTDRLGGRIVQGDPQFATHDETIISDLGLDLRPAPAGSEEALIEEIHRAGRGGAPVLAYFWEPHWLAAEVELAEVDLPGYYPRVELRKYLNADFAAEGGEAAQFLHRFSWDAEDQNEVARLIAAEGLTPTAAAERWVTDHPDRVAAWLADD